MLFSETTRIILSLFVSVMGLAAVALFPGAKAISGGNTDRYIRTGKNLIYIISALVLVGGAVMVYQYAGYRSARDVWVGGNSAFFILMGLGLFIGNVYTSRAVKAAAEGVMEYEGDGAVACADETVHDVEEAEEVEPEVVESKMVVEEAAAEQAPVVPKVPGVKKKLARKKEEAPVDPKYSDMT
jgi:hypothetical protein